MMLVQEQCCRTSKGRTCSAQQTRAGAWYSEKPIRSLSLVINHAAVSRAVGLCHLETAGCLTETSLGFPSGDSLCDQWFLSSHSSVKEINKQIRPSSGHSNHSVAWSECAAITQTLSPPLFSPWVQFQLQRLSEAQTHQTGPRLMIQMSAASCPPMHFSSSTGDGSPNQAWEKQFPRSGGTESRPAFGCEPRTTVVRGSGSTLGKSGPSQVETSAAVIGKQHSGEFHKCTRLHVKKQKRAIRHLLIRLKEVI